MRQRCPTRTHGFWTTRALACAAMMLLGVGFEADSVHLRAAEAQRAGGGVAEEWWSLKPLVRPGVPVGGNAGARIYHPIDSFVVAKLGEKGLRQSAEAGRRTLIRRVCFDLTGLPPKPEEVEAFVADPDPKAYEHLVDRLLASPQYGERWGRHWLDVVHYGETHGYDKDQPRPNAWPYRDYVIRAFNGDKPYDRFLKEQIAGDRFYPGTQDGFEALGFIAAGPWDLIGHAEVPETKLDGKVARHLDRDDMVATTIQTFNSLTVQCAQCHNHKFDPISQEEYYSLQAVFAAVDRADQSFDVDPEMGAKRREWTARSEALAVKKKELDETIARRAGKPLVELNERISAAEKAAKDNPAVGYHSAIEKEQDREKWVMVDLGKAVDLQKITLHAAKDNFNGIGEGFGFPLRFKVEISNDADFKDGVVVVDDRTQKDVPNPKLVPHVIEVSGRSARYIRVTATKLALRQGDYIFALAELAAVGSDGKNVASGASVRSLDSIEAPARWQKTNLTDGWYPGSGGVGELELAPLLLKRKEMLAGATSEADATLRKELEVETETVSASLKALPPQRKVYIGAVHRGGGAFTGTGANGGKPRTIRVLARGNIQSQGKEVGPGTLKCVSGVSAKLELPPEHVEGDRRAALAEWLASRDNPLTWRSIVNRVWQYHFGRGLVETPNDFGRMGAMPTHPELLEWLATEFRDGDRTLKTLHRWMVTSATYRQESVSEEAFAKVDADNRYLWRMNRRKLEAEAVRDTVLAVAGALDLTMEGPSFRDFVVEKPEHSPHYEYHLHDAEDRKTHRRSVYRFIVRSQQQPFMTTLDCADPSMQVGRRNESVSPLQALALLNNSLMLVMSQKFGARIEGLEGELSEKVARAHYEALGRPPTAGEREALVAYGREHGVVNLCRVLFNLNEFSFVD